MRLHGSAVAVNGRGLLICGASGSGKSSLALAMMALGAVLIADDQTILCRSGDAIMLQSPPSINGMIEARGLGILAGDTVTAPLHAVLDLDITEDSRLPPIQMRNLLGLDVPLLHKSEGAYFPAMLVQYMKAGRRE